MQCRMRAGCDYRRALSGASVDAYGRVAYMCMLYTPDGRPWVRLRSGRRRRSWVRLASASDRRALHRGLVALSTSVQVAVTVTVVGSVK